MPHTQPSRGFPPPKNLDGELSDLLGELADYPLEYALAAYPWGEPGPLEPFDGPDTWQGGFLKEWGEEIRQRGFEGSAPVEPIRGSVVSGRGVGKTGLVGMVTDFITSTRPRCKGTVTAGTGPQLETRTWPEIVKWKKRGLTGHWFSVNSGRGSLRMRHIADPENWRVDGLQWQKHNPDSFAGQHAVDSVGFYIFDEASSVAANIIEAADSGMTDGEPMMFMFGNGRRNSGSFFESHNRRRDRFHIRMQVDGRKARLTNKAEIEKDIEEYGEDSDRIRIEVLGRFPRQSSAQFISSALVAEAMRRRPSPNLTDPVIIGCDVAWEGDDRSVIRIRQGLDAHSRLPERYQGKDPMFVAARLADLQRQLRPDAIFVDMTGIGAGVVARLDQLNIPCTGVHNGAKSPDPVYHRQGDYMWGMMNEWLKAGGGIEGDEDLETELTAREYTYDNKNAYTLEKKKDLKARGEASPDDADALALTFAMPVGPRMIRTTEAVARGELPSFVVGVDANPLL